MDIQDFSGPNSFLGRGWGFPPQFNKPSCSVRMVSEAEDICESLHILLSVSLGERLKRPNYGCNLDRLTFKSANTQFLTFIRSFVEQSIMLHEPRIILDNVKMLTDQLLDGLIKINIDYTIRATNSPDNYVFPFYLTEADADAPPIR
ncbi:MAG: GPW/gp25 family protein [Bacteroidota bacterium]